MTAGARRLHLGDAFGSFRRSLGLRMVALTVAFTQPEIAQVGVSEEASERQDLRISIAPLTLTARSNITDQRTGFVKIITDKKDTIVGASIVAPNASS